MHDFEILLAAGREKVKVFGAWLDADIAGRKAGQGNKAAGLIARAGRGEELTDAEKAEVRTTSFFVTAVVCVCEAGVLSSKRGDRALSLLNQKLTKACLVLLLCSKFGDTI